MSIFEYDEAVEMEKIRRVEREVGQEEGREEGQIINKITIIRKNYKGQHGSSLAEILQLEKEYIDDVTKIIEEKPQLSDEQIAEYLLMEKQLV